MTECNMLNFLFEIGIVLLLFSLFKRNKGTFFFMKFSILIIAIPVLFVCSFFYLGTEETLQEAMPGIAIWRCAFILLASLLLLGLSTLISHLSFRNLFNKEQKRKILMIESIVYLVLSIGFMATWIYDVFWSISRLIYLCGKSTVFFHGLMNHLILKREHYCQTKGALDMGLIWYTSFSLVHYWFCLE